jgi:hypothetical protein
LLANYATGANSKVPPITIESGEVSNYWLPKKAIVEEDIRAFYGTGMGCKAAYLEAPAQQEQSYIDIKFSIDSKGRRKEKEIVGASKDVDLEAATFAMMLGISPIDQYAPSTNNNNKQPIISVERLFLVSDSPVCKSRKT